MRALDAFVWAVADGAARRIRRHDARCPHVGPDEARLCAAVRAAARAGDGFDEACGIVAPIVRPEARAAVIGAACALGRALRRRDPPAAAGRVLH